MASRTPQKRRERRKRLVTILFLLVIASLLVHAAISYGFSSPGGGAESDSGVERIRYSASHQSTFRRQRRIHHGASDIRGRLNRLQRNVANDTKDKTWQEPDFELLEPRRTTHKNRSTSAKATPLYKLLRRRNDVYTPHSPKGLTAIRLIGERHSGTTWITAALLRCFPSVNVHNVVVNQKHWMQHSPEHIVGMFQNHSSSNELATFGAQHGTQFTWQDIASAENPKEIFNRTFVVAIFRDPYNWMEAMRLLPHHWPNHIKINSTTIPDDDHMEHKRNLSYYTGQEQEILAFKMAKLREYQNESNLHDTPWNQKHENVTKRMPQATALPWRQFVEQARMTMGNSSRLEDQQGGEIMCQKGYHFGCISPCHVTRNYTLGGFTALEIAKLGGSYHDPIYEQRSDGTPYLHPLELRAAKIKNFVELPQNWKLGGFLSVQYEDVKKRGTQFLLDQIANEFGVSPVAKCNRRTRPNPDKGNHKLEPAWEQWITQNADWEMEARVGYKPRTRSGRSIASKDTHRA
jgi:hypothetical protein